MSPTDTLIGVGGVLVLGASAFFVCSEFAGFELRSRLGNRAAGVAFLAGLLGAAILGSLSLSALVSDYLQ